MHSVNYNVNSNFVSKDNSYISPFGDGGLYLLLLVKDSATDSSPSSSSTTSNSLSLSSKLLQNLYVEYKFDIYIGVEPDIFEDVFLHSHVIDSGYKFSENFSSVINKCKTEFTNRIDIILADLCSVFDFFKEVENDCTNVDIIMEKICSCFSKYAYELIPKCIDFLRSDIIPVTVKAILDYKVTCGDFARKMTYPEMEQLFLHFVSHLEKLIAFRIMRYWGDFRNKNNSILSSVADVYYRYRNPFVYYHSRDETSVPSISFPAAFINKFGEYVSFLAIAKLDELAINFFRKLSSISKEIISYKCFYICNHSDSVFGDLKKLHETLSDYFSAVIKKEFDKKIIKIGISNVISSFLNELVIWNKEGIETNRSLDVCSVIEYIRVFLLDTYTCDACKIIKDFEESICSSVKIFSRDWKNRLGFDLHPKDNYKISSVSRKFSIKYRNAIRYKFLTMLDEKHEFSDGTIISMIHWDKISKNLFPIAQETVRHIVDTEHGEVCRILYNARVVEDVYAFDGSSAGTRKITLDEIDTILKISTDRLYNKNRDLCSRIWRDLINNNLSKDTDYGLVETTKCMFPSLDSTLMCSSDDCDSSVNGKSVKNELPVVTFAPVEFEGKKGKVISMWGLNLHASDNKLVSFIRRKFSEKIRHHLTKLFSGMLRRRAELPSGMVLCGSSWTFISSELLPIATKSVESIVEKQYGELDAVLSNARVVNAEERYSSPRVRKVTDDERKKLMIRAKKLVDKSLITSIRLSWLRVVNKYSTDIGYGYKENSKGIYGSGREGRWGVKLRYIDNVSILNARRKFSSRIKNIVYYKFSNIVKNEYRLNDGTVIGAWAWFRVAKKLFPIAKDEVKHIIEDKIKELEKIISKARVVVDSKIDRELTAEENRIVLENVMKLVFNSLKILFRKTWEDVISPLRVNYVDIVDTVTSNCEIDCIGELNSSSVNVAHGAEAGKVSNDYDSVVKLCNEDDLAILNVRNEFSREINRRISNKYSEIINKRYRFDDGAIVGVFSWRKMSKRILPIIEKEIFPIVENEREKISGMLLKSRVDISSPDCLGATRIRRELTSEERSIVLETVMSSVYKQVMSNFARLWNRIIKLPLVSFRDLNEEVKSELDNIKLELIGSLGPFVDEAINSMSLDVYISSPRLDYMNYNAYNVVAERGYNLFNEGGFINRVESLLLKAQVVDFNGIYRFINDKERKIIFKEFMNIVDSDIDCLVKKRTSNLSNKILPMTKDSSAELSVYCMDKFKSTKDCRDNIDVYSTNFSFYDHSYAKKKLCKS
ncbi:putative coiled coil protein [Candidatus Ichthyocystis hellenicum]|uniref:Putative coiled coil protein n=1 Tax=Candidatus Ichthyocystis hellenicum TaxID=1561003 RepID=A0A0S4M225_9BURK|nr:putative coiled coil protein [Candidatus Ichthyocystis hellenicum]